MPGVSHKPWYYHHGTDNSHEFWRWMHHRHLHRYRRGRAGLIALGVGIYAGICIAQTYEVPRVDTPKELWQKAKDFLNLQKKELPNTPPLPPALTSGS